MGSWFHCNQICFFIFLETKKITLLIIPFERMDKQWKYYLQILSQSKATWKELFDGAIPFITFLVFFC